jgi:ubiquinone/menaquinone biosynthesis C-methylase UbiE
LEFRCKIKAFDREGLVSVAVDRKYYEVAPPDSVAERLVIGARARIFRDFMSRMRPTQTERILDVGVSDVISDAANVLERSYPHQRNITACGIGEGDQFRQAFPEVEYVRIQANTRLPFDNRSFAVATANAVLEHVGSLENQVLFVNELCRVAARVFISVPNRFFPVEHHTALPVAHYQRHLFRAACRIAGKSEWTRQENLMFMTRKRLWELAAPMSNKNAVVGYTGLLLGPLSSNIFLALH